MTRTRASGLIVLQQEAARAQLYLLSDDVDELVQGTLALLLAADVLSTLLSLAQALAYAIGDPELATREELDRLITEQIGLDDLSDPLEEYRDVFKPRPTVATCSCMPWHWPSHDK
ncbi:MAG: hypothetical protein ACLPUG_01615 [Acidimicrobiales bacterium]